MMRRLKMIVSVALATFLVSGFFGLGNLASLSPANASVETATSSRSISDLRGCLTATPVLNVYYLVDASRSLWDENGIPGSDPGYVRADLLANSLREIAGLTGAKLPHPVKVNFALGFFGSTFSAGLPWTPVDTATSESAAAAINDSIRTQQSLGATNWKAGIENAQAALQSAPEKGCDALIWFTDGIIDLGDTAQTTQALADLCGQPVRGVAPSSTPGAFAELRQSGVSVFGVLYNNGGSVEDPLKDYMKPLVEGTGDVREVNGPFRCGSQSPGEGDRAGQFIEAQNTGDLAQLFMELTALIGGGSSSSIAEDGSFVIDPGVTRFEIITSANPSDISLASPHGAIALGGPQCVVQSVSAASKLDCTIDLEADYGVWKISGAAPSQSKLLIFGGLVIDAQPVTGVIADKETTLSVDISVENPGFNSRENYIFDLTLYRYTPSGTFEEFATTTSSSLEDGTWSVPYSSPGDMASEEFRWVTSNLRTAASALALSDVSTQLVFPITLPAEFPTVSPATLVMSSLDGHNGEATGAIEVDGPTKGAEAQVCFGPNFSPTILSDAGERKDQWVWTATDAAGNLLGDCVTVLSGEKIVINVSAQNQVAANSQVKASLPLELKSSNGTKLERIVSISFTTTRLLNSGVLALTLALLLILGLILPLLLLYVVNKLTTRVEYGSYVLRSALDASLAPDGVKILVASEKGQEPQIPLTELTNLAEHFKMLAPVEDAASVSDPDLGRLRAVVSWIPFQSPWFEIVVPHGMRVLSGRIPGITQELRFANGKRALFSGQVSRTWAFVVPEREFLKSPTEPIRGLLVIFDQKGRGVADRLFKRLYEVTNEMRLKERVDKIRASVLKDSKLSSNAADKAESVTKSDLPPRPGQKDGGSTGAVGLPPRPGSEKPGGTTGARPPSGPQVPPAPSGGTPPPPPRPS